jgi:hypothetical protein
MRNRKPDRRKRIRPHHNRARALQRKRLVAAAKRGDEADRIVTAALIFAIKRDPTPNCSDATLDVIRRGLERQKHA